MVATRSGRLVNELTTCTTRRRAPPQTPHLRHQRLLPRGPQRPIAPQHVMLMAVLKGSRLARFPAPHVLQQRDCRHGHKCQVQLPHRTRI